MTVDELNRRRRQWGHQWMSPFELHGRCVLHNEDRITTLTPFSNESPRSFKGRQLRMIAKRSLQAFGTLDMSISLPIQDRACLIIDSDRFHRHPVSQSTSIQAAQGIIELLKMSFPGVLYVASYHASRRGFHIWCLLSGPWFEDPKDIAQLNVDLRALLRDPSLELVHSLNGKTIRMISHEHLSFDANTNELLPDMEAKADSWERALRWKEGLRHSKLSFRRAWQQMFAPDVQISGLRMIPSHRPGEDRALESVDYYGAGERHEAWLSAVRKLKGACSLDRAWREVRAKNSGSKDMAEWSDAESRERFESMWNSWNASPPPRGVVWRPVTRPDVFKHDQNLVDAFMGRSSHRQESQREAVLHVLLTQTVKSIIKYPARQRKAVHLATLLYEQLMSKDLTNRYVTRAPKHRWLAGTVSINHHGYDVGRGEVSLSLLRQILTEARLLDPVQGPDGHLYRPFGVERYARVYRTRTPEAAYLTAHGLGDHQIKQVVQGQVITEPKAQLPVPRAPYQGTLGGLFLSLSVEENHLTLHSRKLLKSQAFGLADRVPELQQAVRLLHGLPLRQRASARRLIRAGWTADEVVRGSRDGP